MGMLYGHAPAGDGGGAFHGLVLRVTGALFPIHKPMHGPWSVTPTASISALIDLSENTWLIPPPEFPRGYYGPTGLHGLLAIGGRLGHWQRGRAWALTVETVALDTYLWYAISRKSIPFSDAWSLALGVEHHF